MSGGKKFELHLTFGRTKSSVQEVIAAMVNKKDTLEKPQIHEKRMSHVCLFCCLSALSQLATNKQSVKIYRMMRNSRCRVIGISIVDIGLSIGLSIALGIVGLSIDLAGHWSRYWYWSWYWSWY